jgi:sec-independent protein translocase protein TatC
MKEDMKEQNVEQVGEELSFWDHLEVLRWALVRIAGVLMVFLVFTFLSMPYIFDQYILAPTTSDFFVYKWLEGVSGGILNFSDDFAIQIININVASQFFTHISTSISLAFVLVVPYIIFEVWKFIRPALFDHEVKHVRFAFMGSTLMFYLGCAVAYLLIFPFTFRFLTEYELSASIQNQIDLSSYIGNFIMMVMVMGLVFEMPILAWLLSCLGLVNKSFLRQYKSYAVVGLLVLSAVITPSGDPFTMMLVAVPLYLLYELSILVVKEEAPETPDND